MSNICINCIHSYVCEEFNADRDMQREQCAYHNDHFRDINNMVEVVRCKDCRMFVKNKEAFVTYCKRELKNLCVNPNDFCSYGEKRSEE